MVTWGRGEVGRDYLLFRITAEATHGRVENEEIRQEILGRVSLKVDVATGTGPHRFTRVPL